MHKCSPPFHIRSGIITWSIRPDWIKFEEFCQDLSFELNIGWSLCITATDLTKLKRKRASKRNITKSYYEILMNI